MTPNLADGVRVQELLALAEGAAEPSVRFAENRAAIVP